MTLRDAPAGLCPLPFSKDALNWPQCAMSELPSLPTLLPASTSFAAAAADSALPCCGGPDRAAHVRQRHVRQARDAILFNAVTAQTPADGVEGWITRSWRRCLAQGHRPEHAPVFNALSAQLLRNTLHASHQLLQAATPVLEKLSLAIAGTHYFAILTNHHGVVLGARGAIDRSDPRAKLITRVGTDLSEAALGTTAIGAVLAEQRSVWLHRGEHFFDVNTDLSCAGAPLFGPDGRCVGVLDLTGVQTVERPELRHLVSRFARHIENALALGQLGALNESQRAGSLLVRLNWAGCPLGGDDEGLVCLNGEGFVLGANQAARQMVPLLQPDAHRSATPLHCSELFAMAFEMLFDAADQSMRRQGTGAALDIPLWSGMRLHAVVQQADQMHQPIGAVCRAAEASRSLREVETALIRQAMVASRGSVLKAARALGVSRATVYRRLGSQRGGGTTP